MRRVSLGVGGTSHVPSRRGRQLLSVCLNLIRRIRVGVQRRWSEEHLGLGLFQAIARVYLHAPATKVRTDLPGEGNLAHPLAL